MKIQQKLKEEMKKKRFALRTQKHQVYALDNEDVTQDVRYYYSLGICFLIMFNILYLGYGE